MEHPPSIRNLIIAGAIDARAIVPVADAHGGITVYCQGRPTHYLLGGEWFAARSVLPVPPASPPDKPDVDPARG